MIKADSNNRILFPQARDVLGVTSMVVGAALQRAPVDMVRHFIINQSIRDHLPFRNPLLPPLTNKNTVFKTIVNS